MENLKSPRGVSVVRCKTVVSATCASWNGTNVQIDEQDKIFVAESCSKQRQSLFSLVADRSTQKNGLTNTVHFQLDGWRQNLVPSIDGDD